MTQYHYLWLIKTIVRLWKKRNYYKYWYEYEKEDNNIWDQHFRTRGTEQNELEGGIK